MALTYTIAPRIEAGSLTITSEESSYPYDGYYGWDYVAYGWKDVVEHPLWTFVEGRWKLVRNTVRADGSTEEDEEEHVSASREHAAANLDMFVGWTKTREGDSGFRTDTFYVKDLVFTFRHSQTGKIIRTEHGRIMRSADGIILRDN